MSADARTARLEHHRNLLRAAASRAVSATKRLREAYSPFQTKVAQREIDAAQAEVEFHRDQLEVLNPRGYQTQGFAAPEKNAAELLKMPEVPTRDEKLTLLSTERDFVNAQMRAAWDDACPDMAALEALHYELQNVEFRIAEHERELNNQTDGP